jgi:hypothetical protein
MTGERYRACDEVLEAAAGAFELTVLLSVGETRR